MDNQLNYGSEEGTTDGGSKREPLIGYAKPLQQRLSELNRIFGNNRRNHDYKNSDELRVENRQLRVALGKSLEMEGLLRQRMYWLERRVQRLEMKLNNESVQETVTA